MKKILFFLSFLLLGFIGFLVYDTYFEERIPVLEIQDDVVNIDEIYIYGTHLNMVGNYNFEGNAELVLYNGGFITYSINSLSNNSIDTNSNYLFNISNYVNDGIYLDEIPVGTYFLFFRVKDVDTENEEEIKWKYYSLKNNSEYPETTYYSMSNYEKKVVISNEDVYPTIKMNVRKVKSDNVYDVVIDPGHGGKDGGASKYGYKETDFTLDIANEVRNKLEEAGMKIKLTHERGQIKSTEKLNEYGTNGRAVIPREVNAKYIFSIHLNSSNYSSVNGLEVYTAKNINYDYSKFIANNLINDTGLSYSTNKINKIYDGIYTRSFTDDDVEETINDYIKEGLTPFDVSTKSNYYYIIRETGGIITGAYVDNRNEKIEGNPYVKSNVGTEAYLLELGYISNKSDLNNIIDKKEKYIESIVNSILALYNIEKNN